MRKRILAVLLSAVMCILLLAGCSGSTGGTETGGGSSSSGSTSVKLLGCAWSRSTYFVTQTYAVEVTNSNKSKAAEYTQLTVTVKDADGKVLSNTTRFVGTIAAGDTIRLADNFPFQSSSDPNSVTVSISTPSYGYVDNSKAIYMSDLKVSNTAYIKGSFSDKVTGEVTNTSSNNSDTTRISVIFKQGGKSIGGKYTFIYNLAAGATQAFEVDVDSGVIYDEFEVVATDW